MALGTEILVYHREAYRLSTEILNQNIALFNTATRGGISMQAASNDANRGSFNSQAFWKKTPTVRRRNAFSQSPTLTDRIMSMDEEISVKVAAGTDRLVYVESDLSWIGQPSDAQMEAFSTQMAIDRFQDMLNVALNTFVAAMVNKGASNYLDASGRTGGGGTLRPEYLAEVAQLYGDQQSRLACWVVNSATAYGYKLLNYANNNRLFTWGNVTVMSDMDGRPIIVSDAVPSVVGPPLDHYVLGLVPGGIQLQDNGDYNDLVDPIGGQQNIAYAFQAEWTFQAALMGMKWNKSAGGPSPTNAALFTGTNWITSVTDARDLGGVLLRVANTANA